MIGHNFPSNAKRLSNGLESYKTLMRSSNLIKSRFFHIQGRTMTLKTLVQIFFSLAAQMREL